MHDPPQSTPAICYSGCVCKKPYVLDSLTKECVLPTKCPCHHGGKSYYNNETFYQGCNTWYVYKLIFIELKNVTFLFCNNFLANANWENGSARTMNVLGFVRYGEILILKHLTLDISISKVHVNTFYPKAHLLPTNLS